MRGHQAIFLLPVRSRYLSSEGKRVAERCRCRCGGTVRDEGRIDHVSVLVVMGGGPSDLSMSV
jgi:hypothetical protein